MAEENIPEKSQRNVLLTSQRQREENGAQAHASILFIDNDPAIQDNVGNMLRAEGYNVDFASTAGAAMELLENDFFELVVINIRLSGKYRYEFIEHIRKHYAASEIIVIAENPQIEEAVAMIKLGAFDYMGRPTKFGYLMKFLKSVDDAIEFEKTEYRKRLNHIVFGDCQYDFEEILQDYTVLQVLGNGLSGAVFLVQLESGEYRAIKILRRHEEAKYKQLYARFLLEADILSKLSHPNIIKIFEYGTHPVAGMPYMIMEYVSGGTVYDYLKTHPDLDTKLRIVEETALALSEVHAKGILHRDIKPANILMTEAGTAKLTDFGVAHVRDSSITMDNEMIGSPAYLAPEVVSTDMQSDERSDIFSLGVVAYELIVGHRPFYADTVAGIMQAILQSRPASPRVVNPEIPLSVESFLAKLLCKNPAGRYQTAQEVARVARDCRRHLLSAAPENTDFLKKIVNFISHPLGGSPDWDENPLPEDRK